MFTASIHACGSHHFVPSLIPSSVLQRDRETESENLTKTNEKRKKKEREKGYYFCEYFSQSLVLYA
jgi:hypothetical protein